jgi:hypothetical protein
MEGRLPFVGFRRTIAAGFPASSWARSGSARVSPSRARIIPGFTSCGAKAAATASTRRISASASGTTAAAKTRSVPKSIGFGTAISAPTRMPDAHRPAARASPDARCRAFARVFTIPLLI